MRPHCAHTCAHITLKEVVDPEGAVAKLADLYFDTRKGYKRFDTLKGLYQTFWAECLKSKKKSVLCNFKVSNREECSVGNSKEITVT